MKYIVKFKVGGIVFTRECEHEYDLFKSVEAIVNEDITRIDKEIWLAFFISTVIPDFINGKTFSYSAYNLRIDVQEKSEVSKNEKRK